MKVIPFTDLAQADLLVDACYAGGRSGHAGDDPLPKLLRVDNQGGFRYRGKVTGRLEILVLWTSMNDPDWPDSLDDQTGIFTYYGDNKKPGRRLHETGRDGNRILEVVFSAARNGAEGRKGVPPIFIFSRGGAGRDVIFLGLAVPGASDLDASEEIVAIWRSNQGIRFQNYRAKFTILDAGTITRAWVNTITPLHMRGWLPAGKRKERSSAIVACGHASGLFDAVA